MSRYVLRSLLFVLLPILTILSAVVGMKICYFGKSITDGHLERNAVELLTLYMEDHEGDWPDNWESLEPQFKVVFGFGPSADQFIEDCKNRIAIDFSANADALRQQARTNDKPTFRVVYAKYTNAIPPTGDPNYILYMYFRDPKNDTKPTPN
jgi:hypothetical protein